MKNFIFPLMVMIVGLSVSLFVSVLKMIISTICCLIVKRQNLCFSIVKTGFLVGRSPTQYHIFLSVRNFVIPSHVFNCQNLSVHPCEYVSPLPINVFQSQTQSILFSGSREENGWNPQTTSLNALFYQWILSWWILLYRYPTESHSLTMNLKGLPRNGQCLFP